MTGDVLGSEPFVGFVRVVNLLEPKLRSTARLFDVGPRALDSLGTAMPISEFRAGSTAGRSTLHSRPCPSRSKPSSINRVVNPWATAVSTTIVGRVWATTHQVGLALSLVT